MPGEEGYPTHLANRLGQFSERSGRVLAQGTPERRGAVTLISAVSPPGGDFSEPVTQALLRVVGALWALDPGLAHQRQFPAVDWETSYSLYLQTTADWFAREAGAGWLELRRDLLELLQRGRELREIAGLVGPEALQDGDRLVLEVARTIREVVLGQSAFDPNDAWSPVRKTFRLAMLVRELYRAGQAAIHAGVSFDRLNLTLARRALVAVRNANEAAYEQMAAAAEAALAALASPNGESR
jgi:V/A-type H+-transporting ATPase subunit A